MGKRERVFVKRQLKEIGEDAAKDISIARKLKKKKSGELADASFYRSVARMAGGVDYIDATVAAKAKTNSARKTGRKMQRVAEVGIEKIASGQALKRLARSAGVLGIAAMFASHLSSKKNKNQRG
jgi:hypothetical protein